MSENCTIFCKKNDLEKVVRIIHAHFPDLPGDQLGNKSKSITVHRKDARLRFTPKVFRKSGDDFCLLLLSTCAFIEEIPGAEQEIRDAVIAHVESCALALGIVAEPAFNADKRFNTVVFALARGLTGMVFNGSEMLDARGATLISA